jgi:predicted house-cleaning noncanonical NTP pyrophosphatase (MazG superfamily)
VTGKLVRDRIPEIIRARGDRPVTRVADESEFLGCLGDKLVEEAREVRASDRDHQAEELADALEVIYAMAAQIGVSRDALEKIREAKAAERGAFRDRIIWLGNEQKELGQ